MVVETSRLCRGGLAWSNAGDGSPGSPPTMPGNLGELVDVPGLDLVWFRRTNYPQELPANDLDPIQLEIVNNEYKATMFGALATSFGGRWVNDPFAGFGAENKLLQLDAARRAGLRVPRTLVSHDPEQVRAFCESLHGEVVVKTVKGSARRPLYTVRASAELVASEEAIRLAPAMYQELVPGPTHIRAHCFGDRTYAFSIESDALDWRGDLNVPIAPVDIDDDTAARLRTVLDILGLRMGVFDLKRLGTGEYVWLEVNPQGQFLFLEGLTGVRLSVAFTDFLMAELAAPAPPARRAAQVTKMQNGWPAGSA
ncbi:ATP-grasp domain-containing protein [Actinoplanes sp. URMC 104]|uniref:ATP-grasp domain-containing protein n=1 Tax=Actinoplanes sp. URMC 104 TaxID=3423409 RepID=UPI003F1B11B9